MATYVDQKTIKNSMDQLEATYSFRTSYSMGEVSVRTGGYADYPDTSRVGAPDSDSSVLIKLKNKWNLQYKVIVNNEAVFECPDEIELVFEYDDAIEVGREMIDFLSEALGQKLRKFTKPVHTCGGGD